MTARTPRWRVGGKVPLNVYYDDKPMFQCHTPIEAAHVVGLLNAGVVEREVSRKLAEALRLANNKLADHHASSHPAPSDFMHGNCPICSVEMFIQIDAALAQYTADEMEEPKG